MIEIGDTASGNTVSLQLRFANRHGLVTGATGTGKTVTLQKLAEGFSNAGVPVFAADIKGDLSGIAAASERGGGCPVALWDIFGVHGSPIRTGVQAMGPLLLSAMLGLNEVQSGALNIAFRKAEDDNEYLLNLDCLRWALNDLLESREEICAKYGNITSSSLNAIQRNLLALESQGGVHLFGEPPFEIADLLQLDGAGRGVVNLLHADQLLESPRLYAVFLLWLLTELFRKLPEVGDLAKPRLIFFFDEAHLLFRDAPKPLLQQIERLARLVRSKGVGIYFVTQSPADVPDIILAQLGNRIQHALRAYTHRDQKMVKAAVQAFRPNMGVDVRSAVTEMAVGEALVSVMEADGVPSPVERVRVAMPASQIGPISDLERTAIVEASPFFARYRNRQDDGTAMRAFTNRMRVARGLAELPAADVAQSVWCEGDYAAFLPNIHAMPTAPRRSDRTLLVRAAAGVAVATACFLWVGLPGWGWF